VSARRVRLGSTGLDVSPLCLGGNVFGWSIGEAASFAVLDAYLETGGNFIDTANIYSAWGPGNRGGESETIIGRWIASRGVRDEVVIATKVGMAGGDHAKGLSRALVRTGIEGSLKRLGVDRIDLFYAHEDDAETPLDETMAAFDELVRAGLVGALGASNYDAQQFGAALEVSGANGLARFEVMQAWFNLAERDKYEGALERLCADEGVGVLSYFSLARGFLTGKYRPGQPAGASPRARAVVESFMNPTGLAVLDVLDDVAARHAATPAQVSLAWLIARPSVVGPVASATTPEQVHEIVKAIDLRLDGESLARLDAVTAAADGERS
jgi:aryl-alcohol dehydrogenase-like predicted oxidoreductase